MKNKLLALLILSVTLIGLGIYYMQVFLWKEDGKTEQTQTWDLEKQVFLEEIEKDIYNDEKETETESWNITNTIKEKKIEEISQYYKIIKLNSETFYFYINWENLVLRLDSWKVIWTFPIVLEKNIKIQNIYLSTEKFLLFLWDEKYIISMKWEVLWNFNFKIPIKYIKEDENNYIIISEKWVFLYDKRTKEISYSYIFSDFIIYDKAYLAIIDKDDKERLEKFSIDLENKNIIFYYNPQTKEQKIIYKTEIWLNKIFQNGDRIYFEDESWKTLELKNY